MFTASYHSTFNFGRTCFLQCAPQKGSFQPPPADISSISATQHLLSTRLEHIGVGRRWMEGPVGARLLTLDAHFPLVLHNVSFNNQGCH